MTTIVLIYLVGVVAQRWTGGIRQRLGFKNLICKFGMIIDNNNLIIMQVIGMSYVYLHVLINVISIYHNSHIESMEALFSTVFGGKDRRV